MISRICKALLGVTATVAASLTLPAYAQDDRYAFTQDYEPSPAIWRLYDEDTTIYMFGTIHLLPEGFRWRSPEFDALLDEVDSLVLETSDADSAEMLNAFAPKVEGLIADRAPTSQQLSPDARAKWREFVASTGMPFQFVDEMPVMISMMTFAQTAGQDDTASYEHGVETVLEAEFSERGKPIQSIENFGRVMYQMVRVNDAALVNDLDQQLRNWGGKDAGGLYPLEADGTSGDEYWAMEHAWARGDVQDEFDLGFGDGELGRAFHEILIERRNREWAEWLEQRLEEPGSLLLAVGAGHFEGRDSLLVFLEERGLQVERLH